MQDVRKTLVVLSQIKTALEVGVGGPGYRFLSLALESPNVTGFSDELIKSVLTGVERGESLSVALARLDIFSEYDQAIIQAGEDSGSIERALGEIIDQHMFIRSLGV